MAARAVDDASARLHELQHAEWEDLCLGSLAFGLALVATRVYPALAVPLFLGGFGVGVLGVRAMWLRWDLVDKLSAEPDAHAIREVRAHAEREATMERRRTYASQIRTALAARAGARFPPTVEEDLARLSFELEDHGLTLDPASAVACMRLVTDVETSPLLNASFRPEEMLVRVALIRAGFTERVRVSDR